MSALIASSLSSFETSRWRYRPMMNEVKVSAVILPVPFASTLPQRRPACIDKVKRVHECQRMWRDADQRVDSQNALRSFKWSCATRDRTKAREANAGLSWRRRKFQIERNAVFDSRRERCRLTPAAV